MSSNIVKLNPEDNVIRRQIQAVEFGFYTDQDHRDRSVVEITTDVTYDPVGTALPGGLYDPRLGPSQKHGVDSSLPCPTCALSYENCPGHFGHIELAVPVYNPVNFLTDGLMTFLRIKCLHCHKLTATARQLKIYRAKFHLLLCGRIGELHDLDNQLASAMKEARDGGAAPLNKSAARFAAAAAMDDILRDLQPPTTRNNIDDDKTAIDSTETRRRNKRTRMLSRQLNSYERALHKELIKDCLASCKAAKKCPHCGAYSPKLRHDSYNKIFQSALSKSHARLNKAEGIHLQSAMITQEVAKGAKGSEEDSLNGESRMDVDDNNSNNLMDMEAEENDASDDDDDEKTKEGRPQTSNDKFMHTREIQAQVERTWKTDPFLCSCLFGGGSANPTNGIVDEDFSVGYRKFFMQVVAVPPSRFRAPMTMGGAVVEHNQTASLAKILQCNERIRNFFVTGNEQRAYSAWIELQLNVNTFMDSSKDPAAATSVQVAAGIKQILERKEGLFRKHMMGKRVDYCCRSVISPDPYVGTNEIGLPVAFAHTLTFPVPVTDLNIKEMRTLVERGPNQHPGARWVQISTGYGGASKRVNLDRMDRPKREAVAARLLQSLKNGGKPAIVGRQLRNGDYVLMNRQPTLHKPGIMAHKVRILHNPTQKTIRMHYANCNTYNADFDGDEMNGHFPQSDLAAAEAKYICSTDLQFIAPTDSSPLRGLIQDHVVSGVQLTKRDTFLRKWEYQQLLFATLASLNGLEVISESANIEMVPPAIAKPIELWTGKQVITTLLLHLRKGNHPGDKDLPGISTERKSKTPETAFGKDQQEHLVLIRQGELLRGVLDKAAFGDTKFSLVHSVHEAYGPTKAGLLLNSLGRLFTAYIQYFAGHSCRMEDLVLTKAADMKRRQMVQTAYNTGARAAKAWADSDGGKIAIATVADDKPLKPFEIAATSAKIGEILSGRQGADNFASLDSYMQSQLNPLASKIVKASLPGGLAVPFPYNTFGVMTTTGAKGSIVNQSQVTCALGQQALEGRRVPRMSSGRTLPSFSPYDPNPRADGFIMDRFLTGIRPAEYYFHCMAGREGLVDTAVKTSRSGYLQRCLMKHLEDLKVCYDFTVRNAEGRVVQFLYGEDGLDPTKACYLDCSDTSFTFMAQNYESCKKLNPPLPNPTIDMAAQDDLRWKKLHDEEKSVFDHQFVTNERVLARRLKIGHVWRRGALCVGWHAAVITAVHKKEKRVDLKYLTDGYRTKRVPVQVDLGRCGGKEQAADCSVTALIKPYVQDPILTSDGNNRIGQSGACVSERLASSAAAAMLDEKGKLLPVMKHNELTSLEFSKSIAAKYSSSLCAPGEAVGSIAAQSIGEPSTQMTLNTFHLAGSGANVTLGIPRLREIIMTASRELKTPTMSVPLLDFVTDKQAVTLMRSFTKLSLLELISSHRGITVTEKLEQDVEWRRAYYITLKLFPAERIREAFGLSLQDVGRIVEKTYVPLLSLLMKNQLRRSAIEGDVGVEVQVEVGAVAINDDKVENGSDLSGSKSPHDYLDDEENEFGEDADAPGEEDGVEASRHRRRNEIVSYDEEGDSSSEADTDKEDNSLGPKLDESLDQPPQTPPSIDKRAKVSKEGNSISLQPLCVDPSVRPLLMVGLAETAAAQTVVLSKKKIEQAFINEEEEGRGRCFQTAGVNFVELWKLDFFDHNHLFSNDTWAILCAYGVEAARNNIVLQIRNVFGAYGISVDPRHLSLIADSMTSDGGYKAMNRKGMEDCCSTLLQMSFETTCHFLKQAAVAKKRDDITSPSANIVLGRPIRHGTGSFAILAKH